MVIEKKVLELIKKHEKFRENAYKCPAGIWTIGYGTTEYSSGKKVNKGDVINIENAEKELIFFCENKCLKTIKQLENERKKKFTINQKSALYSLIYNVGEENFKLSKCYNFLCKNEDNNAIKHWNWIMANGRKLKGLIKRRNEEIELFFNVKDYIKI